MKRTATASSHISPWKTKGCPAAVLICLSGLVLRCILSATYPPYPEAMAEWAERIYITGPSGFYSPEVQWPYPPLYLYLLWISQCLIEWFGINAPGVRNMVLQIWPILADVAAGWVIYRTASKLGKRQAPVLCALYIFNPAVIHNSAMWGQTDGVFSFVIALMCVFLIYGKTMPAYIAYGAALLIKQQSLCFAPLVIAGLVHAAAEGKNVKSDGRGRFISDTIPGRLLREFLKGAAVIAGMVLLSLPFGLAEMLGQYMSVTEGMNFVSVEAYNFWALIGRNWASTDTTLLGINVKLLGLLAEAAAAILSLVYAFLKKNRRVYPYMGALLILSVFCFATGMHERYMLSGLVLLLLAYIINGGKWRFHLYLAFTFLQLANTVLVYKKALGGGLTYEVALTKGIAAAVCICVLLLWAGALSDVVKR
ncbi:MAG: hypothetical protein IKI75_00695 [Lachnospiraceae bacterium]|nr:hypothetical protein [Lachnospiraceae bacterium]